MRVPRAGLLSVIAVLGLASACSVVFDPERYDEIDRCRYDDDCPATPDPRFENICTVSDEYRREDEEVELPFPRICSPRPSVSCDPDEYGYDSSFRTRAREAVSRRERYDTSCGPLGGVQGCPPDPELGCDEGLRPHPLSGRCDDEDDATPPAIAPEPSVLMQDVLDQFCRSVYCDVRFTCHVRDHTCEPCELGQPLGRGGCGDLYPDGVRSSVYQTAAQLEGSCQGRDGDLGDADLGPIEDAVAGTGTDTGTGADSGTDTGG